MSLKNAVGRLTYMFVVAGLVVATPTLAATPSDPTCRCSSSLSFSKPSLQFSNGVLTFIPRVDVSIRSRGERTAPRWTAQLTYDGQTAYTSKDVVVPAGVTFSGTQAIAHGSCGDSYTLKGVALPPVTLTGLTQSLVGKKQQLDGTARLTADIAGCGFDAEKRQYTFSLREFGNLKLGSWHSVR